MKGSAATLATREAMTTVKMKMKYASGSRLEGDKLLPGILFRPIWVFILYNYINPPPNICMHSVAGRYGEMTPQIAGNLELSHIPMVRSRSMSRVSISFHHFAASIQLLTFEVFNRKDVAGATANTFGSPNPMSRKSSAPAMSVMASSPIGYRPVAAVVEGNESEGESSSDEDQEDVKVLYGSRPDESGELENIELSDAVLSRQAYASLQHGSSLFREVSTNEDPASVGEADSVDFDDAERIIRENNLEILLQSSERTKALI